MTRASRAVDLPVGSYARLDDPYSDEHGGGLVRVTRHVAEAFIHFEHVSGPPVVGAGDESTAGRMACRFVPVPIEDLTDEEAFDAGLTSTGSTEPTLLSGERVDVGPSLMERMVHLANLHGRWGHAQSQGGYREEAAAAADLIEALAIEVERHGVTFRAGGE